MKLLGDVVKPSAPITVVDTEVAAAAAIAAGTVETSLVDLPVGLIIANEDPRLAVVARIETNEQYAAALPQGSPNRTNNKLAVDAAMRAFSTDGTLDRLASTWLKPAFGVDPAKIPVVVTK
jgi:polar amino acid transport system substrate-binding protein